MIRKDEFEKLEKELLRKEKLDVLKNFRIIYALYKEVVALGIFPPKDPLEGLHVDIKIAKVVNGALRIKTTIFVK
jgi:hypothetical protein